MIDLSVITEQMRDWLATAPDLYGYRVSRGDQLNRDPGQALNGWIGIYRKSLNYDPKNLGRPTDNYRGTFIFLLYVQRSHANSGQECEDDLEESTKSVLDRLIQIPRTYIDQFTNMLVEYSYIESERTTLYFQEALITVTAQITVEVSK